MLLGLLSGQYEFLPDDFLPEKHSGYSILRFCVVTELISFNTPRSTAVVRPSSG